MTSHLPPAARVRAPAAILAAVAAACLPAGAASAGGEGPDPKTAELSYLDVRTAAAPASKATPAQEALQRSLGLNGVVELDPLTGTPRVVARLDGFLTGPSERDAAAIALDYVRERPDVFGLDEDDLAALVLVRDETDAFGVRHLLWAQTAGGIQAFDNDLRASVTADGRLVNVLGSPLPDLELPPGAPALDASAALGAALRNAGRDAAEPPRVMARSVGAAAATRFAGGHRAGRVLVNDGRGVRLAWRVTAHADGDEVYDTLVDAESGDVLRRANKVDAADASGEAWDYYPGAPSGGTPALSNWTARGWLPANSTTLAGPFARVFFDLDDDDQVDFGEEATENDGVWDYNHYTYDHANGFCAPGFDSICTWRWSSGSSWFANRKQNAAQVFHYVNTFHDHLKSDPDIAWTTRTFENGDRVVAHSNDGAATGKAGVFLGANLPDAYHVSNANMYTPPDGTSPRMQMYLFTSFTGFYATDPTPDVNGGDDATVVYHEYAHGLSNRLITYADGWGALDSFQSGAMGEGWSDWYALDYLVGKGFAPDTGAAGDVVLDRYLGNGEHTLRSEGLDCPVAPVTAACPGGENTGAHGGYTYGDMGKVWLAPEVHADGEIWAQTLWDLRTAVGVADARYLVTQGMRLSPRNPSFLDMRNAILQANTVGVAAGRADRADAIWAVFAGRGMGWFAATEDADDTSPIESFALPPDPSSGAGSLAGTVSDADTGAPLAGVRVSLAGVPLFAATTDSVGRYAIPAVPAGTYPKVLVTKTGYSRVVGQGLQIEVDAETPANFGLRRDWSSYGGGGRVSAFNGPDYTPYGCGPRHAIDQSLGTGWSSARGTARWIVVKLPAYVDVTGFGVDPGAICGDDESASLREYRLEVAKAGAGGPWTTVKTGSFALADAHRVNALPISKRRAVRYVRLTLLSNHGDPSYVDVAELEVYGPATPTCFGEPATKVGTASADRIAGTSGADVIVGLGGNDRIDGKGGKDLICGGDGDDTLTGGAGADRFDGGAGADTIFARDGVMETTIRGGTGSDRVRKDASDRTSGVERSF